MAKCEGWRMYREAKGEIIFTIPNEALEVGLIIIRLDNSGKLSVINDSYIPIPDEDVEDVDLGVDLKDLLIKVALKADELSQPK